MKTLKTIILGLVAVVTFGAASAKNIDNTANEKTSINYAVNAYVNAIAHGQNEALTEVLDNNFKFTMLRGKTMVSCNKAELMEFLKTTENVKQDCKSTVMVNESNADITVVKVNMQYKGFLRTNYVTLANTNDGWKITNVYSVFK
ncbi:putative lumazine-binding protein [Mucilaginibacter gracilis]|uniref:Putative lumazine-binding protein n=1 Tax=Mucilaginibacter gracilis TaxID=423350 RepID=A0A495J9W4_9SPHI|nr:nuclear transport factor 2 family protein [Mucilaginibacter gracilis]RKR85707.1 putative lumazine-binding protein [Mucilaginibacter gracilis]